MRSTSIFSCKMAVIFNFTIFFIFHVSIFNFLFYKYNKIFHFHMISAALLLIDSFLFETNYLCCVLSWELPHVCTMLTFYALNYDFVSIKKPDGLCVHLPLLWMDFQDYFYIHLSFLLNIQDLHKQWMMLYQIFNVD